MIPGGIADKLGNDYEANWTIVQALHVLHGLADEIRLEAFDEDASGFEFRLTSGGENAWHQCKRRRSGGSWTIRALETEGVLAAFARKLAEANSCCVFVSSDNAQDLKSLTEKADLVGDLTAFQNSLSNGDRIALQSLANVWAVDAATTFAWLKRCRVETVSAASLIDQADGFCKLTFTSPPSDCRKFIADVLDDNLTRTLTTEAFRSAVTKLGWKAQLDPTLPARLGRATDDYLQTLTLPDARTVVANPSHDAAVATALEAKARIVIVAGAAGGGKSLVMSRIIQAARDDGRPVLALRIDRFLSAETAEELGEAVFGHAQSPVLALGNRYPDRDTLLVIDQVDAVSEASGRSSRTRDHVFRMIEDSGYFPRLRVVLACRTYDLEHDRRLSGQAKLESTSSVTLTPLDWEQGVKPVLDTLGLGARVYSPAEQLVLTTPINLQLLAQLQASGERVDGELSAARLFDRLLLLRARELREIGLPWTPAAALGAIARHMSNNQELAAPEAVLASYPGAVEHLSSVGLITAHGGKLQFAHESFFDQVFARQFAASGDSVATLLRADEQRLFRRTQVRQIFSHLRDLGTRRYLSDLAEVMEASDVRYLVKDAVGHWLSAVSEPTDAERALVDRWFQAGHPNERLANVILTGANWTPALIRGGLIRRWLDQDVRRDFALWVLGRGIVDYPDLIAPLLRTWWKAEPDRLTKLLDWFKHLHPNRDIGALTGLYAELAAALPASSLDPNDFWSHLDLSMWSSKDHALGIWLLGMWLEKWMSATGETTPFGRDPNNDADHWLPELAKDHPVAFAKTITPLLAQALALDQARVASGEIRDPAVRAPFDPDYGEALLLAVETAVGLAAIQAPDVVATALDQLGSASPPAMQVNLRAIASGSAALGGRLVSLATAQGVFAIREFTDGWRPFAEAAKAAWPHLDAGQRGAIEQAIHAYTPELDQAKDCVIRPARPGGPTNRKYVIWDLNHSGRVERAILSTIGAEHLSPSARARLDMLERKFPGQEHPTAIGGGGIVEAPIPSDRLALLSDAQWLSAMQRYVNEDGYIYLKDRVVGGARQLATALGGLAKTNPERFTNLLEIMPLSVNPQYAESILWGVSDSDADAETVVRAIKAVLRWTGADCRRQIAWAVRHQPAAATFDQAIFDLIVEITETGKADDTAVRSAERPTKETPGIRDILKAGSNAAANSINEDRGAAYMALQSVLWEYPEFLAPVVALLDRRLEAEPLTSVRLAMLGVINSVGRHDPDQALTMIARVAKHDPAALLGAQGQHVLAWAKHQSAFDQAIIPALISADNQSVKALGLVLEGSLALLGDARGESFALRFGDPFARRVAGYLAAANVREGAIGDRSCDWLKMLWNDADPAVRKEANLITWSGVLEQAQARPDLIMAHIQSFAFVDHMEGADGSHVGLSDLIWAAPIAASMAIPGPGPKSAPQSAPCPKIKIWGALPQPWRRTEPAKFLVSRGMGLGTPVRPQGKKGRPGGCGDGPAPGQIRPEEDAVGEPRSGRRGQTWPPPAHAPSNADAPTPALTAPWPSILSRPDPARRRQARLQEPDLAGVRGQGRAGGRLEKDQPGHDARRRPSWAPGPSAPRSTLPWSSSRATASGLAAQQWSQGRLKRPARPAIRRGGRARRGAARKVATVRREAADFGYTGAMTALPQLAAAILACTAPTVHDGDTLRCGPDRIRLFGVDAPEVRKGKTPAEPLAYEARDLLIQLTRGRVGCRVAAQDRYGRSVARCWSSASPDINAAMIRSGLTTEWRAYSKGAYSAQQDEAREAKRGLWAAGVPPRRRR
jgi:endonuclease YncB( thermonuclease family)